MDVAELHDNFTIGEIMALEDLKFVPKGQGGIATEAGETQIDGRLPINPSGGLKARGNPIGATEVFWWRLATKRVTRYITGRYTRCSWQMPLCHWTR